MKPQPFLSRFTTLQLTLGISVALHAALLSVRFIDPEGFNRVFQDTPLEVILVNAKSSERPDKAQAIAQANMAGGGEADKGRATSPLPYSALTAVGDDFEESQRRLDTLQEQQTQLLAQLRKQLASLPEPDLRKPSQSGSQASEEEKRRQLVKLLAEIEKRINQENARPKKRYISPATREEAYAVYYSALSSKVEDKGTENFPERVDDDCDRQPRWARSGYRDRARLGQPRAGPAGRGHCPGRWPVRALQCRDAPPGRPDCHGGPLQVHA